MELRIFSIATLRQMLSATERFCSLIEREHLSLKMIDLSLAITSLFSKQFILSLLSS